MQIFLFAFYLNTQLHVIWQSYLSFPRTEGPSHLESVTFCAHPARLYHDSLSWWHHVLIAIVHSSDAGLVVMAQPFLLWMFFLPEVTRHFNIHPVCPWLALCSAGRWIQSITSQRLFYLVWGHLVLFWAIVAVLCGIWVILCIDPYAASYYFRACVGQ